MTRTTIALVLFALSVATACAPPVASITDDAVDAAPMTDRIQLLRQEVASFEGQPVLELDRDALSRMREWLTKMETSPSELAALYEQAVRAQLEYLRTSELRYYTREEGSP
jgi:hypothetical protein